MAKQRELVPLSRVGAAPGGYKCSKCERVFSPYGNLAEADLLKVRAEFKSHNCREDSSQAALRVVREATEGNQ